MRPATLLLSSVFAFALGCGDNGSPACETGSARLAVVTYNTGLGPGMVALSTPRAPHVAEAVASTDFDVLCLQEVWTAPDRDAIVTRLGFPVDQVLTADTFGRNDVPEDRCAQGDLDGIAACMNAECADAPDEDASLCALDKCQQPLVALYFAKPHCLHCVAASAGKSANDVENACLSHPVTRIQGGGNGIILASRWPLLDPETMPLPAGGANRVALFARVRVPGAGEVEIACTHLSANQDVPPPHSGYDDWGLERDAQFRMISDRLAARAGGRPQLFVGDMNFGVANGSYVRDNDRESWDQAVSLGFSSPAAEAQPPLCSSCGDNNLHGDSDHGSLIDHALLRDPSSCPALAPAGASRLYDAKETIAGHDGRAVETDLSDHYGIRVVFTAR
ncbi:MAG TPA: endonuclease/exonuclease/phosphatase family protein [Candidatus Eisenbacteria bacterium]|nr:endonuclease/exonuclease/phosphatase family protein [Candidatus Eisenbacteria bacterium]